jgi:hypothetical protein
MMAVEVHFGDAVIAFDRMFARTEVVAGRIRWETILSSGVDINKSRAVPVRSSGDAATKNCAHHLEHTLDGLVHAAGHRRSRGFAVSAATKLCGQS